MNTRGVHALVVAYNGEEDLRRCLTTLAGEVEVTVVDNSSSAEVQSVSEANGAQYVDSQANRGFAAGVNVGLRAILAGPARDVLLLNPDALVTPEALSKLSSYLHLPENRRAAALAPHLCTPQGAEQRVAWPFPSPLRAWFEALGLESPTTQGFVIGAVILLRWEAVQDVGMFDERFFLYAEETDWQRRAAERGWVSRICPEATAVHIGAGTSDNPALRESLFHAAQETYVRKWYGAQGWLLYRLAVCFGAVGRVIILTGDRRAEAARRLRLYIRGPRRCAALTGR